MKVSFEEEKAAIENCENQVLTDIDEIQSFGYLLALNADTKKITHASENCVEWFKKPLDKILNAELKDLFPRELVHSCKNTMGHSTITTQREQVGRVISDNAICDVFMHLKGDYYIFELQPASLQSVSGIRMLSNIQRILERIDKHKTLQELLENCVEELRHISGFHRVKAYKFLPDGSGEVVAESLEFGVDSFLGLRFPAFDIPKAARKLYSSTPIRIIPSVSEKQVKLVSFEKKSSLDLSLALFRGVVPVHQMYLENMGVKGSLSLPIVIDGEMWGLFAFHHMEERMLESEILSGLEILGNAIAGLISTILKKFHLKNIKNSSLVINSLFVSDDSHLGFTTYWNEVKNRLMHLINCNGVALLTSGGYNTFRDCLSEESSRKLINSLVGSFDNNDPDPIAINSIYEYDKSIISDTIAGVMIIPNSIYKNMYLLFFRKESAETVTWAGNPEKDVEIEENGFRLNPRGSFNSYKDSTKNKSDIFDEGDISIGRAIIESTDMILSTLNKQSENRKRLGLIIRELNHRVRNTLALVSSIISQSHDTNHSLEEYLRLLENRIQSLSEAQLLLTENEWKPIKIQKLLDRLVSMYSNFVDRWNIVQETEFIVPPNLVSLLSLVIHELTSNAIKYGAFSNSEGKVNLKYYEFEKNLIIEWKEENGPPVKKPTRHGFGTDLINEALVYEFDAKCETHFLPKGFEAKFTIPIELITVHYTYNDKLVNKKDLDFEHKSTVNKVFVLEDDYMISKELIRTLKELKVTEIKSSSSLEGGLATINAFDFDFAVLDVNIRGLKSIDVAQKIEEKGIPYIFATGYGSKDQDLKDFNPLTILTKPIKKGDLKQIFQKLKKKS